MTNDKVDQFALLQSIGTRRWNGQSTLDLRALPVSILTFSIAGEDMALRQRFKRKIVRNEPGVYVDIGCRAPVGDSNTYMFYAYGWSGLCIDVDDSFASQYAAIRPRDKFAAAAVGFDGEALYYRHKSNAGMNRVSSIPMSSPDFESTPTPCRGARLADLIAENLGDTPIDFFTIDVEGAELDVLKSNDWSRYRPHAIMMECVDFRFEAPFPETVRYLLAQGYGLMAKVGQNVLLTL